MKEVHTQAELDAAIAAKETTIKIGNTRGAWLTLKDMPQGSRVDANQGSLVYAYQGSLVYAHQGSRVDAHQGSLVDANQGSLVDAHQGSRVYAYQGSRVDAHQGSRVYAYQGSRVDAYRGSRVDAKSLSTIWGYDQAEIHAASRAIVIVPTGHKPTIVGDCIHVSPLTISTVKQWCAENNAEIHGKGKAAYVLLGKAVDDKFQSPKGGDYTPDGKKRVAADWDGGLVECGHGLHFCATSGESRARFYPEATKGVACKVYLRDIAKPKLNAEYPEKVKARACTPLYECDWDNEKIQTEQKEN